MKDSAHKLIKQTQIPNPAHPRDSKQRELKSEGANRLERGGGVKRK